MASIRRALFSSSSDITDIRCSTSSETVEISCKASIRHACEPTADYVDEVVEEKGHVTKKVLVVGKNMVGEICKQLAGMPLLQDIPVVVCSVDNLPSVCNREKLALVFVDKCLGENCISEICTTVRFSSSSQNKTVAIIGVNADQDAELCPVSSGLTEVITFPLQEDTFNQLLLKYAGIIPFRGLPLTPESPDDDIAVARKAEEIIRESEEQSLLGYDKESYSHKDSDKMESSFHSTDTLTPNVTLDTRHSSGFYTDSNTSGMSIRSNSMSTIQGNTNLRQPLPFINQELRRPPLGSNSCIVREINDIQDAMYNRHHTSWTITNDQISENISPNILPIPTSYSDQFSNYNGSQLMHGQCVNPTSCAISHQQATTSNQFKVSHTFPYPSQTVQDTRTPQNTSSSLIPHENHTNTIPSTTSKNQEKEPAKEGTESVSESGLSKVKSGRGSAYMVSGTPGSKDMLITMIPDDLSKHSSKERIRRERIKDSCDRLRYLLPNISGKKTDMASILEMTVKFVKLIKDRVPPAVMEEIADELSASTVGMTRKRAQKDANVSKQKAMRIIPPVPVSVPSAPLTSGEVNHIIYTAFSNNSAPLYHPHGQHCSNNPHQYNQYLQGIGCGSPYSPLSKDIHHGYIHYPHNINQQLNKEIPTYKDTQLYHNYPAAVHSTDVGVCPHRQLYGAPLSIITSSHNDVQQQSSFMKLPPINVISPCSSICSSKDQDTGSSTNTSFDSPMWDDTKGSN